MTTNPGNGAFATITQRAVSSYQRLMAGAHPIPGVPGVTEQSQRDLHAFFADLYASMSAQPELFGLPVTPDAFIAEADFNKPERKQVVKRLLDKPKRMIEMGMLYLMVAGMQGGLDGNALFVADFPVLLAQTSKKQPFIKGLESTGLTVQCEEYTASLTHRRFPAMMPALKAMAEQCAAHNKQNAATAMFARCDLRGLCGHTLQPVDLYGMFDDADRARVLELHRYFSERGYKTELEFHAPGHWVAKYQGDRAVKTTPLYQVGYDDRHEHPVAMQIKCASTARLAEALPKQSPLLRDDFARRVSLCRGDDCGWCKNQKTLAPTVIEINGETKTVCWYVYPDVRLPDGNTVELIRQYERMHAGLAA